MKDETTDIPLNDEEYQNYLELYSHIYKRDLEAEKAFRNAVAEGIKGDMYPELIIYKDVVYTPAQFLAKQLVDTDENSNNRTQTEQTGERLRVEESVDKVDKDGDTQDPS